jgi:uncharacterized protein YjbI with pentapeptide repeats
LAATAANERRARLNKVNFRGVVLRHAHLHEASLVGTNLTGADLTGAIVLPDDSINNSGC